MTTRYFYDTEFLEDGKTIELISIGIVADDGREYYAVAHDARWDKIRNHGWLCKNVVPHLPLEEEVSSPGEGASYDFRLDPESALLRPKYLIANEVRDFLTANSSDWKDNELWANYGAYDHVVLCQLWGSMIKLPEGVPMFTRELQQLWWDAGRPEKPPQPKDDHHALADAKWNYELWKLCQAELTVTELHA